MIDEDLKQRKIANGTYTEDWILHKLIQSLKRFEKKGNQKQIDLLKIKIRNRVYKIGK